MLKEVLIKRRQAKAEYEVNKAVSVFQSHKLGYSRAIGVVGNLKSLKNRELKKVTNAVAKMNKYEAGYYPNSNNNKITADSFTGLANHYAPIKNTNHVFCQEKTKSLVDSSIYASAGSRFLSRVCYDTRIQASPNAKILNITIDEKQDLSSLIESWFMIDRESKKWDYTEQNDLAQLADIALKNYLDVGEFFAVLRQSNSEVGVNVQLFSPLQIRTPFFASTQRVAYYDVIEKCNMIINASGYSRILADGSYISNGIEYDNRGREQAIFIAPNINSNTWTRLAIHAPNGEKQVLHGFIQGDSGQERGLSELYKSWHEFMNISDLEKFEIESAKINASISGTVTSDSNAQDNGKTPMKDLGHLKSNLLWKTDVSEDDELSIPAYTEPNYSVREIKEGGYVVQNFTPGYKYTANDTTRPNVNIPKFIDKILEYSYPSTFGLVINVVSGRFEGSYNASKGGIDISWKNGVEYHLKNFKSDFYNPIYSFWFMNKVAKGIIPAPNYFENRKAYEHFNMIIPRKPSLNPFNEIKAAAAAVELGASTIDRTSQEITGTNSVENMERLKFEKKILREINQEEVDSNE